MEILKKYTQHVQRNITTFMYNRKVYNFFEYIGENGRVLDSYIKCYDGRFLENEILNRDIRKEIGADEKRRENISIVLNDLISCHEKCEYIIFNDTIYDKKNVEIDEKNMCFYSLASNLGRSITKADFLISDICIFERNCDSVVFGHEPTESRIFFQM